MPPTRRKASNTPAARSQQTLAFGPNTTTNKVTKASLPTPPSTTTKNKNKTKKRTPPSDADRLQKAVADAVSTTSSTATPSPPAPEKNEDQYPPPLLPPETTTLPDAERRALAIRRGMMGEEEEAGGGGGGGGEDVMSRRNNREERSDAEEKAGKVSEAQIKRYWKGKEGERIAPRVHQAGLSVDEKILRHFDLSSLYGPCIGIPRMKRWKRAENLGLKPPVEVLAVLLKEDKSGNGKAERAFMEGLLTSRLAVNE